MAGMQLGIKQFIAVMVLITIYTSSAQAEIYTCKDAKGNIVYTDSPSACSNAEAIKTDKLPTLVPSKTLTSRPKIGAKKKQDENPYVELKISSPSNDSVIRDNQGNLTINFQASPGLQTRHGHKYVVIMNGAEVYSGTSTIAALKNVDRGTQTIVVKVIDAEDKVMITSEAVTATLQRFSARQRADVPGTTGGAPSLGNSTGAGQFSLPTLPQASQPVTPTPAAPPPPATP